MEEPTETGMEAGKDKGSRRRRRMSPEMRREMILEAAIGYFADHGFEVQIRQLASKIGISPALIFKYFETKDALIDAVYEAVFESRWQEDWVGTLTDRSIPLPERLIRFYRSYMATVDDRNWIRIAMRASLDNSVMTRRYLADHVSKILVVIADEIEAAPPGSAFAPRSMPSPELRIEYVWHLHSTVIYYLIRKHIHQAPVLHDQDELITLIVDQFLHASRP
jgi:AcrR family transcriptional regulator